MSSVRLQDIKPSALIGIIEMAADLKRQGVDLVDFGVGEPDFPTPQYIQDAAIEAMKAGFTKYTKNSGIDELKEAIGQKIQRLYGTRIGNGNVLITAGAKHGLFNFFLSHLNPGEKVIIFSPYWVSFPEIVKLAGGQPIFVPCRAENKFLPDPKEIEKSIDSKTVAIIVNSPCNPTGVIFPQETMDFLVRTARDRNLYLVMDECYEAIVYEKRYVSPLEIESDLSRLVLINSFSKTYSMTGWRIGYTVATGEVIEAMARVQQHSTSCANSIAQRAAFKALTDNQDSVRSMVQEYRRRRDYLLERVKEMNQFYCPRPDGTFFAFHDVREFIGRSYKNGRINNSVEFCNFLLEKARVVVSPGEAFGMQGFVRLSYANSMDNIKKGLDRIVSALQTLN